MKKSMGALSGCQNDCLKLVIISAHDPEVLAGLERAWRTYFEPGLGEYPIPISRVSQTAADWILNQDFSVMQAMPGERAEARSYLGSCKMLGIPLITVRWPGDPTYTTAAIPAPPELLFQLHDFARVKRLETTVRFYHTQWLIVDFSPPAAHQWGVYVCLAPLECIDLDA